MLKKIDFEWRSPTTTTTPCKHTCIAVKPFCFQAIWSLMFSLPWGPVRLEKNTCTEWILKKNINNSGIFNLHLSCSTFALFLLGKKITKHLPTLNILPLLATCLLGVFLFVGDRLTRPDKPVATPLVHRQIMAPAMKWMAKKTTESTWCKKIRVLMRGWMTRWWFQIFFFCYLYSGKILNLTNSFFNWVETTNQLNDGRIEDYWLLMCF